MRNPAAFEQRAQARRAVAPQFRREHRVVAAQDRHRRHVDDQRPAGLEHPPHFGDRSALDRVGQAVEHVERVTMSNAPTGRGRRGAGPRHAREAGTPGDLQAGSVRSKPHAAPYRPSRRRLAPVPHPQSSRRRPVRPAAAGRAAARRTAGIRGTRNGPVRRGTLPRAVDPRPYCMSASGACRPRSRTRRGVIADCTAPRGHVSC